jgi:hypothetical protein
MPENMYILLSIKNLFKLIWFRKKYNSPDLSNIAVVFKSFSKSSFEGESSSQRASLGSSGLNEKVLLSGVTPFEEKTFKRLGSRGDFNRSKIIVSKKYCESGERIPVDGFCNLQINSFSNEFKFLVLQLVENSNRLIDFFGSSVPQKDLV